jgi:hypothetical protein
MFEAHRAARIAVFVRASTRGLVGLSRRRIF